MSTKGCQNCRESMCKGDCHTPQQEWRDRIKELPMLISAEGTITLKPELLRDFIEKEITLAVEKDRKEVLEWAIGCVRGGDDALMTVIKRRIAAIKDMGV